MKFVIYQDTAGEWRWTLKARNGRKVADGAEGYKRKASCVSACSRVRTAILRWNYTVEIHE